MTTSRVGGEPAGGVRGGEMPSLFVDIDVGEVALLPEDVPSSSSSSSLPGLPSVDRLIVVGDSR